MRINRITVYAVRAHCEVGIFLKRFQFPSEFDCGSDLNHLFLPDINTILLLYDLFIFLYTHFYIQTVQSIMSNSNTNTPYTAFCTACGLPGHRRSTHASCPMNPRNIAYISSSDVLDAESLPLIESPTAPAAVRRQPCICGSTSHSRVSHHECVFNVLLTPENSDDILHNIARQTQLLPFRHVMGDMDVRCIHCSALMWIR